MSELITDAGLILILRNFPENKLCQLIPRMVRAGVKAVEVAFNPSLDDTAETTCGMMKKIIELSEGKMIVGAGTVLYPQWVKAAKDAGCQFIFSPNTDTEIIKLTKELGMISIPGAYTPSEVMTAHNAGADLIKLFPITVNEIGYFKNIKGPLSHIKYVLTGGVNPDTIVPFLEAGAVGLGTGISILKPELVATDDFDEIERLARLHMEIIENFRKKEGNKR
ncbi:MAG: bifunctional 4-hydroxy-2-oxoglutarate aldolase/2-dehydro-3-deoxy-phosphogluconate aldolase [Clostridia bacterium]|nr:bifunctional 4-hydroxy-2-oxoglutarate aldolase/2-dehydro-3-deoxy-phosphogluconate aldolase [Clostridia bacterium]